MIQIVIHKRLEHIAYGSLAEICVARITLQIRCSCTSQELVCTRVRVCPGRQYLLQIVARAASNVTVGWPILEKARRQPDLAQGAPVPRDPQIDVCLLSGDEVSHVLKR
jgi:hypothetical protein